MLPSPSLQGVTCSIKASSNLFFKFFWFYKNKNKTKKKGKRKKEKLTSSRCQGRIGESGQGIFGSRCYNQQVSKRHSCWRKKKLLEIYLQEIWKSENEEPGMHGKNVLFPKLAFGWMTTCWLAHRAPGIGRG